MKLRTQLTLTGTAVAVLAVALAGLLIMLRADHLNADHVDRALTTRADEISAAATRSGALPADTAYAVRLIQNGKVRATIGPATTFPLPAAPGYATVTVDGHRWRSLTRILVSGTELEVLHNLDDVEASHIGTARIVDLAILLAALLAAAGSWYLAGLGLSPLDQLSDGALGASPGDPDPPEVAAHPGGTAHPEGTELAEGTELTETLSGSLDRLGADLEKLLSDPDLPATQRHLLLAAMTDEHARMLTTLDEMQTRAG